MEITWNVQRKYITIWKPDFDAGQLPAGAQEGEVAASLQASPLPPPLSPSIPLLSPSPQPPPPSPAVMAAVEKFGYPVGTIVVVRSVDMDPGRSLKFARSEQRPAGFHELLGREVRLICCRVEMKLSEQLTCQWCRTCVFPRKPLCE